MWELERRRREEGGGERKEGERGRRGREEGGGERKEGERGRRGREEGGGEESKVTLSPFCPKSLKGSKIKHAGRCPPYLSS